MNQIEEVRQAVCAPKYLEEGESFHEGMARIADHLKDNDDHFMEFKGILRRQEFLPGGRVQASAGAARQITSLNCYAGDTIEDSMEGIFAALTNGALTLRLGGGDGWDFSTLRPKGALIKKINSTSSGPISFMKVWDAMCNTIMSAGHRRGAMMATIRIDHPDVEEFITCKQQPGVLNNFNISVLVTDEFMEALKNDEMFDLKFDGMVYKTVSAKGLWNKIMRNTWDHAEPGVLYIDRINEYNNLYYCETISTTNPCGEQPLPPHGACLLGSWNLTKFVEMDEDGLPSFNYDRLCSTIPTVVRAMDNVLDRTIYPLEEQRKEALDKRRMGLGVTGLANVLEYLGIRYGSDDACAFVESVLGIIRDDCYRASVELAKEKGPFPAFTEAYLESKFIQTMPEDIINSIAKDGIRNSHLLSIAPTGTISLWAGNISGGIEPVFAHEYDRTVIMPGADLTRKVFHIQDYAYAEWGLKCPTSDEVTAEEHIKMLCAAAKMVDSACSKTCNVGDNVTFDEFKELYLMAYEGGAKGCTTFRPAGFREGVLKKTEVKATNTEGDPTCTFNPETGERSCAD